MRNIITRAHIWTRGEEFVTNFLKRYFKMEMENKVTCPIRPPPGLTSARLIIIIIIILLKQCKSERRARAFHEGTLHYGLRLLLLFYFLFSSPPSIPPLPQSQMNKLSENAQVFELFICVISICLFFPFFLFLVKRCTR